MSDMIRAFQDEDRAGGCSRRWSGRPVGLPGLWLSPLRRTGRPGNGKRARRALSSRAALSLPVHGHNPHAPSCDEAALRVWLTGLWLILQSDKGISSVRLAEALGVSQPTAWRMGHALRFLVGREHALGGMVEIDEF